MSDEPTSTPEPTDFDCPRCGSASRASYYRPCDRCRDDLRATMAGDKRDIEPVDYEPKMNVVPNQVATKD
jgi:endogenous inhibitor of DNA gyrase (YacG/DUF329 family)